MTSAARSRCSRAHVGARFEHRDVSYNIDGAIANWPGGGGGATMIITTSMLEEVNHHSAALAEMAGGVNINMVTKAATWAAPPLQLRQRRSAG